jgi:uncharacterized protein with NAD-binding domain and iron-sulfur cluster
LIEKLEARGAQVLLGRKIVQIEHAALENQVTGLLLDDGSTITGDIYISAMPVHSLRKVLPPSLKVMPYFDNLKHLKGQPVITAQLYFDRMVPQISPDYNHGRGSVIELVVAPAEDLIRLSDEQVLEQVLADFYRLHPVARQAQLLKYTFVRIPNSVYQARPGVDKYRPDQQSPTPNFFLTGDYTQQEFMASIEGAIRSARRTIERIDRATAHHAIPANETA